MPTQVQIRGAAQATQEARTLASRELDINTTDKRLCVHDGSTAGGIRHVNSFDHINQEFVYAAATGTNALAITLPVAPTAYQAGQRFSVKVANTITGGATLNVNSLGAKTIKKLSSGALVAVEADDLVSGAIYDFVYDGTDMLVVSGSSGSSGGLVASTTISGVPNTVDFADIFKSGKSYRIDLNNIISQDNATAFFLLGASGTTFFTSGYAVDGFGVVSGSLVNNNVTSAIGVALTLNRQIKPAGVFSGSIWIYNPQSTASYKAFKAEVSFWDNLTSTRVTAITSGEYRGSTGAIGSFRLKMEGTDNLDGGVVSVYEYEAV